MKDARYVLCSITTKDVELLRRSNEVRLSGVTHERIYKRGIEEYEKELDLSSKK